jgi:hypothetical protein
MRQIEPTGILPPHRFRLTDHMIGYHGRRTEGEGVRAKYRNCLGLHATYWRGLRLCKYLERNFTNLGILHEKLFSLAGRHATPVVHWPSKSQDNAFKIDHRVWILNGSSSKRYSLKDADASSEVPQLMGTGIKWTRLEGKRQG